MAKRGTNSGPPVKAKRDYVERALDGIASRLEKGSSLSDKECTMFCALLQAQNNRNLMSDADLLEEWETRFTKIENWIRTRETVQQFSRRAPQQQRTPPGSPFDAGG